MAADLLQRQPCNTKNTGSTLPETVVVYRPETSPSLTAAQSLLDNQIVALKMHHNNNNTGNNKWVLNLFHCPALPYVTFPYQACYVIVEESCLVCILFLFVRFKILWLTFCQFNSSFEIEVSEFSLQVTKTLSTGNRLQLMG